MTYARADGTFVYVLFAKVAGVCGQTKAGVLVDAVHTGGTVLAQVARAVVNVLLAVLAPVA